MTLRHCRYLCRLRDRRPCCQSRIFAPHNWNRSELLFVISIGLPGTNLESYCEAAERPPHPHCGITALLRTHEGTPSMPNLKVGETAPSMDSAEQSLIDRIWTAIDAKDWETARSLLEDGISVMPDSLNLLQLCRQLTNCKTWRPAA